MTILRTEATASTTDSSSTVRFRDLGTLLVEFGGEARPTGGTRLDAALALLLMHADQRVGAETMAAAIWGDDTAPRSSSTLDSHIWRLRKVLEPHRTRGVPPSLLIHDHGGFRLVVRTDQVDSLRFEQLAQDADDLLADGQHDRALRCTEEALGLWRGRPFTPVTDQPWAAPAVTRLEEMRGQVRERHVEALLAVGEPERALVELQGALTDEPLRESLWAQRMLACHRLGRTDEALQTYRQARTVLLDELGVEPGAELRDQHARILADDPALRAPRRRAPTPTRTPAELVRLPVRRNPLVGRDAELRRVAELVSTRSLTTIVGTAGCGKTRLAIEAARTAAASFPDGVCFVALHAAVDAGGVLDAITSAVGVPTAAAGSPMEVLRAFTSAQTRRALLVLDNCEHVLDAVADLVQCLLEEESELAVLATSREPLDLADEHVEILRPLPVPRRGAADPGAAAAVELFVQRLPAEIGGTLTAEDLDIAARIARAVDGVPLAIELAAARARAYTLAEIAEQVTADPSSLSRIGRTSNGRHDTVRDAIDGSYRLLDADDAALHRGLCAVPGPFTPQLAQVLPSGAPSAPDLADGLTRLVHRSLLVPLGPRRPGGTSRFAQLSTVRGHAAHAAGDEAPAAAERRDRWIAQLVESRHRLGSEAERTWMEALDDDLAAVRATLQHTLVDAPSATGIRVVSELGLYGYYREMRLEAQRWLETASALGHVGDPLGRGHVQLGLAAYYGLQDRADRAVPCLEAGLATVRGDEDPLALGDRLIQLVGPLVVMHDRYHMAIVTALLRRLADCSGDAQLAVLAELAELHLQLVDEPPSAALLARCAAVYDRAAALHNSFGTWTAALRAALVCLVIGAPEEGLAWSERMVDTQLALGIRNGAGAFSVRANLLAAAGASREAVRLYAATRTHHRRAGLRWPRDDLTRTLLEQATSRLDRCTAEEARGEGHNLTLADLAGPASA